MLQRDMVFRHEGQRITHPRLHRAFLRGVVFLEEEEAFAIEVGPFRGLIEVEDTAFWAVSYDPATGEIALTDGTREVLDPATLTRDPDEALRCRVKGRLEARFTRAGQAHLLDALDEREGRVVLRLRGRWVPVPGLSPPA